YGRIDRDLEGLDGRPASQEEDDGEAGKGEEEDDRGKARQAAPHGRPVDHREPGPGSETQALPRLQPAFRDGIQPGQQDASGKSGVEDDMRGDDTAQTEKGDSERAQPTRASPHGEETEG